MQTMILLRLAGDMSWIEYLQYIYWNFVSRAMLFFSYFARNLFLIPG